MVLKTCHSTYPPFATGLATAPLVSISLHDLEINNASAASALYTASKDLGFFYLDMAGSALGEELVAQAEALHLVQKQFSALPNSVKETYLREKIDKFFGYRILGGWPQADGSIGRNENYNMRKDDLFGNKNLAPLPHPPLIKHHWDLLASYARNCRKVIDVMFLHLERGLGLPTGTLLALHRNSHLSGDHIRFNKSAPGTYDEAKVKLGEHTDFGSLTILFNWLGGLQIRHPETDEWVYVPPVPGSAVVNLGDALVKFSAGVLRSNVHRVAPAPAPQDKEDRFSLVFFSRPEDSVVLKRLKGGVIDLQPVREEEGQEMTSEEWILKRSVGTLQGVYTHKGGLELRELLPVVKV